MARLGRKRFTDPPVKWKVSIPTTLAAEVELLITDPVLGKPIHGKRSQLIAGLLRQWVEEQRKK